MTNTAVTIIDSWLEETISRELFSADDVRDRLLDLRLCLIPEPVG